MTRTVGAVASVTEPGEEAVAEGEEAEEEAEEGAPAPLR